MTLPAPLAPVPPAGPLPPPPVLPLGPFALGLARGALPAAVLALAVFAALPAPASETLVAARTIRATALIGPADVVAVPGRAPGALSHPDEAVGLEARVALYAGRPIRPGDVGPAAVVERNGIVVLLYRRGGLTILAEGRALGRAAPGESLRVMNLSSRTTVTGIVAEDGVVHVAGSAQALP